MFSSLGCALTTSKYHKRAPICSKESWVFYSSCFVQILLACRIHDILRFYTVCFLYVWYRLFFVCFIWSVDRINRPYKTDKKVCYFLFSLAFWSRFAIKNYIFFTRRAFTSMYHYGSGQHRIHSFLSFLVFFGYSFLFFALSWLCNPLFPWPCNSLFSLCPSVACLCQPFPLV